MSGKKTVDTQRKRGIHQEPDGETAKSFKKVTEKGNSGGKASNRPPFSGKKKLHRGKQHSKKKVIEELKRREENYPSNTIQTNPTRRRRHGENSQEKQQLPNQEVEHELARDQE